MGGVNSKLRKILTPFRQNTQQPGSSQAGDNEHGQTSQAEAGTSEPGPSQSGGSGEGMETNQTSSGVSASSTSVGPFVMTRQGSQEVDEDGDIAHEFWEEVVLEDGRVVMRKNERTTPQGIVPHEIPRLHMDYPQVIHHVN